MSTLNEIDHEIFKMKYSVVQRTKELIEIIKHVYEQEINFYHKFGEYMYQKISADKQLYDLFETVVQRCHDVYDYSIILCNLKKFNAFHTSKKANSIEEILCTEFSKKIASRCFL